MDSPGSQARLRIVLEVLLILVLCIALVLFGVQSGIFSPRDDQHRITLRVTGGGGSNVKISYSTSADPDVVESLVSTPWEKTMNLKSGTEVYLTAASTSETSTVECIILLDRTVWKKVIGRAPKTNIACAGIVP